MKKNKSKISITKIDVNCDLFSFKDGKISGGYYSDKSGYMVINHRMEDRSWQDDSFCVEDGTLNSHLRRLDRNISFYEERIRLMKDAKNILSKDLLKAIKENK